MDKRTLLLHIGIHRTATTSIQHFLKANHQALLLQGFLLPNQRGRHRDLVNRLYEGPRKPRDVADDLNKRANDKPHPVHTIILSDEDISLRKRLKPFVDMREFFDVKVVIALRRQDRWLESWYLQNIRWQWDKTLAHLDFDDFMKRAEAGHFHWIDYDRYLKRLERAFGQNNLLVNIFERPQMPHGPIVAFAESVGLDMSDMDGMSEKNASLSPLMAEFGRQLPIDTAEEWFRSALIQSLANVDKTLDKTAEEASRLLLSHERRRAVLDRYAARNRAVSQRYFDRETLFQEPLPPDDAPIGRLVLPAATEDMIARIVRPVMQELILQINDQPSTRERAKNRRHPDNDRRDGSRLKYLARRTKSALTSKWPT